MRYDPDYEPQPLFWLFWLAPVVFFFGGLAGAWVADLVAHPDSDYMYGDSVGRLVLGFVVGGLSAVALGTMMLLLLRRRASNRRQRHASGAKRKA